MWEHLITPLLTFAGVAIGVLGKGIFDTRFKRLDDAAQIRKELREELNNIKERAEEFWGKYQAARERIADLDIACARCFSRLAECAEVISQLLEAEECLDKGNVRKAETILKLIALDQRMREQMDADETARPK